MQIKTSIKTIGRALASVAIIAIALYAIEFATRTEMMACHLWDIKAMESRTIQGKRLHVTAQLLSIWRYDIHHFTTRVEGNVIHLSVYREGEPFRSLHFWRTRKLDCEFNLPKGVTRVLLGPEKLEIWPNYYLPKEIKFD